MKSVSVVVLNWNEWEYTANCVRSLQQMDYPSFEILVVDNHSSDDSVERLRQTFPDLTILVTERNLGFAGGCNRGIARAFDNGADFVWLLNNDTVVAPDALSNMVAVAEGFGKSCLVGSSVFDLDGGNLQTLGGAYMNGWTGKVRDRRAGDDPLHYIIGASMLIPREVIEAIGLLDEWYFFYWEDADYCRRARKAGFDLLVAEDSRVYHRRGGSSCDDGMVYGRSSEADFHLMRGAIRFLRIYEGRKWPIAAVAALVKCALLSLRRKNGVGFDRIPILFRGLWSGMRDREAACDV